MTIKKVPCQHAFVLALRLAMCMTAMNNGAGLYNNKSLYFMRFLFLLLVLLATALPACGETLSLATGEQDGLYNRLGVLLQEKLKSSDDITVELISSKGSRENMVKVEKGEVDFAIVQAGTRHFTHVEVITPLFVEPVLVLAKRNVQVNLMTDLNHKRINLGAPGSGSRVTAERILKHYEIEAYSIDNGDIYGDQDAEYDVAVVVGGLLNAGIKKVIRDNNLKLVPIQDSRAIALQFTHLRPYTVPRGIFSQKPIIPDTDVASIASTAVLVARKGVDEQMVDSVLKALYETDIKASFPLLMTPNEVRQWSLFPLKPKSLNYLDPYSGIGHFANFAESIAAIKEIIFALIAAAYFAWVGLRKREAKKAEILFNEFKEKLDVFLDESVEIERQCTTQDVEQLQQLLDRAIELKLKALTELTHERLRGDNLFAIFLAQCSSLIVRIEQKLKG